MHLEALSTFHLLALLAFVLLAWGTREALRARQAAKRTARVLDHALRHPGSVKVAAVTGTLHGRPTLELVVRGQGLVQVKWAVGRQVVRLKRAGVPVVDERTLCSLEDLCDAENPGLR